MTEEINGRFDDRRAREEKMLAEGASDSVQTIHTNSWESSMPKRQAC